MRPGSGHVKSSGTSRATTGSAWKGRADTTIEATSRGSKACPHQVPSRHTGRTARWIRQVSGGDVPAALGPGAWTISFSTLVRVRCHPVGPCPWWNAARPRGGPIQRSLLDAHRLDRCSERDAARRLSRHRLHGRDTDVSRFVHRHKMTLGVAHWIRLRSWLALALMTVILGACEGPQYDVDADGAAGMPASSLSPASRRARCSGRSRSARRRYGPVFGGFRSMRSATIRRHRSRAPECTCTI